MITQIAVSGGPNEFRVLVNEASSTTAHEVVVEDDFLSGLGLEDCDRSQLLMESFRFLLEREPKESIMRKFEISVIERYFPEYPDEIRLRMGWANR